MKFPREHSLREIAEFLDIPFKGDADHSILGLNEIHKVEPGDIVFVDHPKYYEKALESAATTVLINKEVDVPEGKGLLISQDPFTDFNRLSRHFKPFLPLEDQDTSSNEIHKSAQIHPSAVLGKGVKIGAESNIGPGVILAEDTLIGDRVIIHANTVLGGDAFYYKKRGVEYDKMHSCGNVVIEDDVEIGALCTIDRGVTGSTVIGAGTKIDNKVHVGHDTVIGKNCLFAAQVGIAGCVIIEDEVTLWGQVGVPSDLTIGKGAIVLGQSGVHGNTEGGKTYFGSPAIEAREKWKELAMIRKLPELIEKLK